MLARRVSTRINACSHKISTHVHSIKERAGMQIFTSYTKYKNQKLTRIKAGHGYILPFLGNRLCDGNDLFCLFGYRRMRLRVVLSNFKTNKSGRQR